MDNQISMGVIRRESLPTDLVAELLNRDVALWIGRGVGHEDRRVNGIRIIGAPATTEPAKIHGKKAGYQFYQYTIKGKKPKLYPKLITIRV